MTRSPKRLLPATSLALVLATAALLGRAPQRSTAPTVSPRAVTDDEVLRQARRAQFLAQKPGTTILYETNLLAHPDSDFKTPEDWRLVRRSDGATLLEFKETLTAQQLEHPTAYLPAATLTYVNLKTAVYRTFNLAGAEPNAEERQRMQQHAKADGVQAANIRPFLQPAPVHVRNVRQPVGSWVRSVFDRAADRLVPTASAQGACSGQWYGVIGAQDPNNWDMADVYPILNWGLNPNWYAYGSWTYYNAWPSPAGTHWYFDGGDYQDWNPPFNGGPPNNAGYVFAEAWFHNTDFPLSFGNAVYVYLSDSIIRNQDRSISKAPYAVIDGYWTSQYIKNVPQGYTALSYYDGCP
jgi:hypothetical protein